MSFHPAAGISEGRRANRPRSGSRFWSRRSSPPCGRGWCSRLGSSTISRACGAERPRPDRSATSPAVSTTAQNGRRADARFSICGRSAENVVIRLHHAHSVAGSGNTSRDKTSQNHSFRTAFKFARGVPCARWCVLDPTKRGGSRKRNGQSLGSQDHGCWCC
jgi:hypothetical protein